MIRNNYTGIGFKNHNVIVQKLYNPKEIKISISAKNVPSEEQVDNIVGYLGEEGFLDYDEEPVHPNFNPFINPHEPTHRNFAFNKNGAKFAPKVAGVLGASKP